MRLKQKQNANIHHPTPSQQQVNGVNVLTSSFLGEDQDTINIKKKKKDTINIKPGQTEDTCGNF